MKYFIYFLYNGAGEVHSYVPAFLDHVRDRYDVIHVVVNGELQKEHKAKLHMADIVQERPNDEFDVGAYKAAIYSNPDEFYLDCTEVTLANFTFFAPIGDMAPYYDWVEKNDFDFWGLSAHKEIIPNPFTGEGKLPYHIQSHWISIGKSILQSGDFIKYWRELGPIESYIDSVLKHESQLTPYFAKKGYNYGLYFDDRPYDSEYPAFNDIDEAVEAGLPIFKRRLFYHQPAFYYDKHTVNVRRAIEYCDEKQLFDPEMIWESSVGADPWTIYQAADLLKIVPDGVRIDANAASTPIQLYLVVSDTADVSELSEILKNITASSLVTLFVTQETDEITIGALRRANPLIKDIQIVKYKGLIDCFEQLKPLVSGIGDSQEEAILFGFVSPNNLKPFKYGMRHVALNDATAQNIRHEFTKSQFYGLGMPSIRTYGEPAETDILSEDFINDLRSDFKNMSFKTKFDKYFLYSESCVFWAKAQLLSKFVDEVLNNLVEKMTMFEDIVPTSVGQNTLDIRMLETLITAGLPFLAADNKYLTLLFSNTRELPRNYVKSEQRLRVVSQRVSPPDVFALDHHMEYIAQYLSQKDRDEIFSQVHTAAYRQGWDDASQKIWSEAYNKGRAEGLSNQETPKQNLDQASREEIHSSAYLKGWEEASKKVWEQAYQAGFNEGVTAPSDNSGPMSSQERQSVHETAFHLGLQQGSQESQNSWQLGYEAGVKDQPQTTSISVTDIPKDIFDSIYSEGFKQGWVQASSNETEDS